MGKVKKAGVNKARMNKFIQMYQANETYKYNCKYLGEDCDKVKYQNELVIEAGFSKHYTSHKVKSAESFQRAMIPFQEKLNKIANGEVHLERMQLARTKAAANSMTTVEKANQINALALEYRMDKILQGDTEYLESLTPMDWEKIQNTASKAAKTAQLMDGKATENVAQHVKIEVTGDRAATMGVFQAQQKQKEEMHEKAYAQIDEDDEI